MPWPVLAALGAWALVAGAAAFPSADPRGAGLAQGWAWEVQRSGAPSLGTASGVPPGDLPVAWLGQPDKLSYLSLGSMDAGSLTGATLELALDPAAPNLAAETAELRACVIITPWSPGEPMAWDTRPETACDGAAGGTYDPAAGAFRFELAPVADALSAAGAQGLAIEPAEQPTGPFQVVFKGAQAVSVRPGEGPAPLPSESQVGPPEGGGAPGATTQDPAPVPAPLPGPSDASVEAGPTVSFAFSEPLTTLPFPRPSPFSEASPAPASERASAPAVGPEAPVVTGTALPAAAPGRPVSLSGVYAVLVALAALPIGGRLLCALGPAASGERA